MRFIFVRSWYILEPLKSTNPPLLHFTQALKFYLLSRQYLGSVSASNESVRPYLLGKMYWLFYISRPLPVNRGLIFHADPKASPVILQVAHVPTQESMSYRGTWRHTQEWNLTSVRSQTVTETEMGLDSLGRITSSNTWDKFMELFHRWRLFLCLLEMMIMIALVFAGFSMEVGGWGHNLCY